MKTCKTNGGGSSFFSGSVGTPVETPKWMTPMLLFIDLHEKVILGMNRRARLAKVRKKSIIECHESVGHVTSRFYFTFSSVPTRGNGSIYLAVNGAPTPRPTTRPSTMPSGLERPMLKSLTDEENIPFSSAL